MPTYLFLSGFLCLALACQPTSPVSNLTQLKQEVTAAEAAFAKMATDQGIAEAFASFAAEDAVIKRQSDTLIRGREAIRNYYSAPFYKSAKVEWKPDFVDVSANGDLAYTYGKYLWSSQDSTGKVNEQRGVFHTVWKRQKDGSWKYVWD